jgi:Fur family ferric uptake transcriptional regulator
MRRPAPDHLTAENPLPDDLRQRWRPALRAAGLKCTEQRLAVLRELEEATGPVSHRDIIDRLSGYQWETTTLFRNLVDLFEAGFLSRFDVGDHTWRYELRCGPGAAYERHPHFLCTACGAIACLPSISLTAAAKALNLQSLDQQVEDLLVKGRCQNCYRPNL